jgi:Uma2 family endonuclease
MVTRYASAPGMMCGDHLPSSRRAEQNMAMPAMRHRWTTADVRALIDESRAWPRYELLGGELVVTPAPAPVHQVAVSELMALLRAYVLDHDLGVILASPADLELRPGTISQPDFFVVPFASHERPEGPVAWSVVTSLLLAIEVISPGSVRIDRVEKRDHYLSAGVPEYWVVDLDARLVERWRPDRENPELLRATLEWRPRGAPAPLVMDLLALFDTISRTARRIGVGR